MLTVMVFALGSVSGAQFLGGILAACCYTAITGGAFIFAPLWHYTAGAALVCELLYSIILIYVVLNVATI